MAEMVNRQNGIFVGSDLKFALTIDTPGFSMDDDDFKIILRNSFGTKKVEIEKSQMLKSGEPVQSRWQLAT